MVDIVYRAAQPTDAPNIARLHVASWRDAYRSILASSFLEGPIETDRYEHWTGKLRNLSPNFFVDVAASSKENIVGFVAIHRDFDPHWGNFVDNLHVLPNMRGQKIGRNLLCLAAQKLALGTISTGLYLWVFEENAAAVRFYETLGGCIVERATSQIPAANRKTILRIHWPILLSIFDK